MHAATRLCATFERTASVRPEDQRLQCLCVGDNGGRLSLLVEGALLDELPFEECPLAITSALNEDIEAHERLCTDILTSGRRVLATDWDFSARRVHVP
jgi:hypothetical protein